ncbi:hypothetical protein ABZT06_45900 [Streptomyces sp. NPDC005483]|uniref:hypothetical protein n=1 Tax=Streptomyces sp. NPDC005483 TaxID=3154882 RepID=UPI0033A7E453
MVRDTRLVQTAVIGDEHSDVPIVLPTEAIELDGFRRVHAHDTFWCGVLLGGCGAQLAHKLYVDRQCHFQHFPQPDGAPHACRRPRVGESSADHLYVKSAMARSLLEYGRAGSFAFPPPIGSLVDVDLEGDVLLRVHMDGAVSPDWTGGRIPVLGPGVVPEPGVLSRCPYVYRVRCESDGASRRVWIGTQSLARPTEWVPLAECSWTNDGLITPAASEILQHQPSAFDSPAAGTEAARTGVLPEHVIRFVRGLEAAQRSGTVEHVRRLYAGSGPFLDTLTGPARAEAQQAVDDAREWLTGHEDYQQRVFADLEKAVDERRAWDVRSQLQTAAALTRRGASTSEQRVLAAARAFLRQQDHLPAANAGRAALYPPPLSSRRKRNRPGPPREAPKPQPPRRQQSAKERLEQVLEGERQERRQRRAALQQVRSILRRLGAAEISVAEERRLITQLTAAASAAGSSLSGNDRRNAKVWIEKQPPQPHENSPRAQKKAPAPKRPTRRELPPDVLESAAAAVRGALKKAARAQTTTGWARLKQQLGSALPHMTLADRVQVLTLVDQTTPADQALLSTLVAAGDPDMMTSYREVAAALGLDVPADDHDLRDVLEADVQQVHTYWHHK